MKELEKAVDWSNVVSATFRVEQSIRYDYASPIRRLRHKLVISPRAEHGDQDGTDNQGRGEKNDPARLLRKAHRS